MEPIHAVEYELTSELTTDIQRTLLRFGARHDWRRDVPLVLGWLVFAGLLAWPVFTGWWSPGVAGAVLFVATLFMLGGLYRRRWQHVAAASTAVAGFQLGDRRVRLEFHGERVLMQTEYFRGEGPWSELEAVVLFANFWALRFGNGGQIVIPNASLTPELKTFLQAKAAEQAVVIVHG